MKQGLKAGAGTQMGLIPYAIDAMKQVAAEKMALFGSVGRA